MSVPTNTFLTYEAIGIREDLIGVITNISPLDTWITGHTGSVRAKARFHEWQTDELADAAANAVLEGADAASTAVTPTERLGNYCQILRKVFQVSDTQDAVDTAGRKTESAYQLTKHLKELAKDIEYALLLNTTAVSGSSAVARQLKGILGFIATNVTTGTGSGNEALTETMVNDNLQLIWAQGGNPHNVLAGAAQKRAISNFSTNTRNVAADKKMVTRSIDVYQSDFGEIVVRLHHILNTNAPRTLVILGDMGLWKKAWLRPVKREKLARTGSSNKFFIEGELTLESLQEKGSGKITQLTT